MKKVFLIFGVIILFTGCGKDGAKTGEVENDIISFEISISDNPNIFRTFPSRINLEQRTVTFHNPHFNINSLIPKFSTSSGSTMSLKGSTVESGVTSIDFTTNSSVNVEITSENGNTVSWELKMTRQIVDLVDFLTVCPLDDPNIGTILDAFEFRINGEVIENFPCAEPYYSMRFPTESGANTEFYTQTVDLQSLRFLYYLDYDSPYIVPWAGKRLYDWLASNIDGINIVDGIAGGFCCNTFDSKVFIGVANTRTRDGLIKNSGSPYWGFRLFRTDLILHETRHTGGFLHSDCCPVGTNACDTELDLTNPGAYGVQVWWTKAQWENIYDYGLECAADQDPLFFTERQGLFDPNVWSERFCSGEYTFDFPSTSDECL